MNGNERIANGREALRVAKLERDDALRNVRDLCERGRRGEVIPYLMFGLRDHPSWRKIRLWQLDAVMFHVSQKRALTTIRRMRRTVGDTSTVRDGYATLGWAVESREATVRMTTWLWLLLRREGLADSLKPGRGFPYADLYDDHQDQ